MMNSEKCLRPGRNKSLNISVTVCINMGIPFGQEICQSVGLSSTSTVHGYLHRLEELGFIRRDPAKNRTIELLDEGSWRSKRSFPCRSSGRSGPGKLVLLKNALKMCTRFPLISSEMTTALC